MSVAIAPELMLANSLMPFEEVLRQSPLGMAVISFDGIYVAVNEAYCQIYGYQQEQLIGQSFTVVFKPEMRSYVLERHRRFLNEGGKLGGEWEVVRSDGSLLHVISESAQVTASDGQPHRLVYVTDITSRRNMEHDLIMSRMFAHAMLDSLSAHICVLDECGMIISSNKSWRRFFLENGGDPDFQNESRNYLDICHKCGYIDVQNMSASGGFCDQLAAVLRGELPYFEHEYDCHSPNEQRWFIARVARIPGTDPMRVIISHDNVTPLKRAQVQLNETLHFTRKLINSMQDGFMVLNTEGIIIDMNPALTRMTGYGETDLMHCPPPFFDTPQAASLSVQEVLAQKAHAFSGEFEMMIVSQNGHRFPANITLSAVTDEQGCTDNYIVLLKNITERKRMEDDIRRMAFYDPLTNLPNRRLLHDRIEQTVASCKRTGMHGAVLMIDLDNFKPLNDKYGHDIGDQLLIEVSSRLRSCVREIDTVARMGGDEFVVVVTDLHPQHRRARSLVAAIAEKIRHQLTLPYLLPVVYAGKRVRIEHRCSASIGAAIFDAACNGGAEILKLADQAMYKAKEDGRNRVQLCALPGLV